MDNANNISGISHLLAAIGNIVFRYCFITLCMCISLSPAQNIDKGLITAQFLKARVEEALKDTATVDKRIKRLSSTLDSTSISVDGELFNYL